MIRVEVHLPSPDTKVRVNSVKVRNEVGRVVIDSDAEFEVVLVPPAIETIVAPTHDPPSE